MLAVRTEASRLSLTALAPVQDSRPGGSRSRLRLGASGAEAAENIATPFTHAGPAH